MLAFTIPGLEWLGKGFAYALKALYDVTGNFGLAIILLTAAMRVVILPLTIKQTKSMIAMQRLQPQLKEIQKKYKDDREKQGAEMMKLYKENKVSPLGGCLPLLIQLPIIFAVFDVLHNLANKESAYLKIIGADTNFMFLGMNMTMTGSKLWTEGGLYVHVIALIALTILTGYISAKMMTTDPKQSKLMAIMPVVMGIFAWVLPAGVTIYILVTNVLTIIQQYVQLELEGYYDEKRFEREKTGEPFNFYERLKWGLIGYCSKGLVLVKLKKEQQTAGKGETAKGKKGQGKAPAKKASSGKAKGTQKKKTESGEVAAGKKGTKGSTAASKKQDAKSKTVKDGKSRQAQDKAKGGKKKKDDGSRSKGEKSRGKSDSGKQGESRKVKEKDYPAKKKSK